MLEVFGVIAVFIVFILIANNAFRIHRVEALVNHLLQKDRNVNR